MKKRFNVTGVCIPRYHYMVDLSKKVDEIKKLVDQGEYFTINRARQYGKTTTLAALKRRLDTEYSVFLISFEGIEEERLQVQMHFAEEYSRFYMMYFVMVK